MRRTCWVLLCSCRIRYITKWDPLIKWSNAKGCIIGTSRIISSVGLQKNNCDERNLIFSVPAGVLTQTLKMFKVIIWKLQNYFGFHLLHMFAIKCGKLLSQSNTFFVLFCHRFDIIWVEMLNSKVNKKEFTMLFAKKKTILLTFKFADAVLLGVFIIYFALVPSKHPPALPTFLLKSALQIA